MKDFRLLVTALDLGVPASELEKLEAPLLALEAAFRPLVAAIPLETEPAYIVAAEEEPL